MPLASFSRTFTRGELQNWYQIPVFGKTLSITIQLITSCIISSLLTQRFLAVNSWKTVPWIGWLVFLIYVSSLMYSWSSLIFQFGIGNGTSNVICYASAIICAALYLITKVSGDRSVYR